MRRNRLLAAIILLAGLALWSGTGRLAARDRPAAPAAPESVSTGTPMPTASTGTVASAEQLATAEAEWATSGHADTYDGGLGADTTCARCKSPLNWQPDPVAALAALDCAACKREPGQPRPNLSVAAPVLEVDWQNIGCRVCHEPAGDSYLTSIAFWNNELQLYEEVGSVTELCDRCHEGQHGFWVVREQAESPAHKEWECTACHGPHGAPSACSDCHDTTAGAASAEHVRHLQVDCTTCHDAGGLPIWQDTNPESRYSGIYMTFRMAHADRSWPSHNLQRQVSCGRCHHPLEGAQGALAPEADCEVCHPAGAVWDWCPAFPRQAPPAEYQRR